MSARNTAAAAAFLLAGALASRNAAAQDANLCCSLAAAQGTCVAQANPCNESALYGVAFSDVTDASFPSGTDGYMAWSESTPRMGLCLVAPSASDPAHAEPTEPVGCIQVSLSPGVGADIAQYVFPVDSRWNAYEFCYGPPLSSSSVEQYGADGGAPCANVNDLLDSTVSPTPASGSCCGAAQLLRSGNLLNSNEWTVTIAEEIPGVPPTQVLYGPDGGIVASAAASDGGDYLGGPPHQCSGAYDEPEKCGQPIDASVLAPGIQAPAADGGSPTYPSTWPTGPNCSVGVARRTARMDATAAGALLTMLAVARKRLRRGA